MLLQLADFAAFCVARMQWVAVKSQRTAVDNQFLTLISDISRCCINIKETYIDPTTFTARDYERTIDEDRREKGLQPYQYDTEADKQVDPHT
jgi:hypothetical protein